MDSIATYAVLASALFAAVYFYVASAGKRSPKIKGPAVLKAAAAATAAIAPASSSTGPSGGKLTSINYVVVGVALLILLLFIYFAVFVCWSNSLLRTDALLVKPESVQVHNV